MCAANITDDRRKAGLPAVPNGTAASPGRLSRMVDWFISDAIKAQSPDVARLARIISGGSLIYLALAPAFLRDLLAGPAFGALAVGGIVAILIANSSS